MDHIYPLSCFAVSFLFAGKCVLRVSLPLHIFKIQLPYPIFQNSESIIQNCSWSLLWAFIILTFLLLCGSWHCWQSPWLSKFLWHDISSSLTALPSVALPSPTPGCRCYLRACPALLLFLFSLLANPVMFG